MRPDSIQMNWLDRAIGFIFPNAALRRLQARRELARAEAPRPTGPRHRALPQRERDEEGWRPFDAQRERERW